MNYRADIDGLRAIAVVSVLLYHAGFDLFSGGFVGVDIFFVISGYLITSIISRDIAAGSFSIIEFYERRARRIIPALLLVLLTSAIFAHILFLTPERNEFGKSLIAASLFYSNFHFWSGTDYFGAATNLQPLLHTWSLAIEEQFYIIFPIILLIFSRRKGYWFLTLTVMFIISLSTSIWIVPRQPESAFYLLHSRAWELITGALLALTSSHGPRSKIAAFTISSAGLLLVILPVIAYSDTTPFPGAYAVPPCIGTALLIYSGQRYNPISRILGSPIMVAVGLMSYSLYLWHWPVLVIGKYYLVQPASLFQNSILILASVLLSYATWKFVEIPFRNRHRSLSKKLVISSSITTLVLASIVGGFLFSTDKKLPNYVESQIERTTSQSNFDIGDNCHSRSLTALRAGSVCVVGNPDKKPKFAFWGDSHGGHYNEAVSLAAENTGISVAILTRNACAPLLGVNRPGRECDRYAESVLDYIKKNQSIESVILSGYWSLYASGHSYRHEAIGLYDQETGDTSSSKVFQSGLNRTLASLSDHEVWIMRDIPTIGIDVPGQYARLAVSGRNTGNLLGVDLEEYRESQEGVSSVFSQLKRKFEFNEVKVSDVLCDQGHCSAIKDGELLYRDGDHLAPAGSRLFVDKFMNIFGEPL